ncbi:MAG: FAD-dependent oxidoreductase [Candidatus Carbobacillus sp.]|nr:FAD-dependent oxidoreductase [Candidatus Carbobacillus sp.]
MSLKYEAIVVGAGPAGITAAYELARRGRDVLLIERGPYPGSKNVMGGILYTYPLREIIPNFWEKAPLERPILEQRYMLLDDDGHVAFAFRDPSWSDPPNAFSVLRAKFDQWYAAQAVAQGALLINETTVTELIVEDERVVGVRVDRPEGDVYADVVILADGANSLLAKQIGFHKEWLPEEVALAVMEVLSLPKDTIESRFNIGPEEGVSIEMLGEATLGLPGMAWLYTNKESLSIGVGVTLSSLREARMKPYALLERLKAHPTVQRLIEGSKPEEYLAHLIPEGGYRSIPRLVGHGVVVTGDAAQFVNAVHREGSNFAILSGKLAAEVVDEALSLGDTSENVLVRYRDRVMRGVIGADLKKYADTIPLLEKNPHYLKHYMPRLHGALRELFTVDGIPKKEKQKRMIELLTADRGKWGAARDVWRLGRAMW